MTRSERAIQIWQVLLGLAYNRQTITYKMLAKTIGIGSVSISLTQPLELIMNYCDRENYPPLTILVVQGKTGIPGRGLLTIQELNRDREKVYNFEWYKLKPLQLADIAI